jgi:hypothetical protein
MMPDAKFVLGYRDTAVGAKAELYSRGTTGRERAQELVSVLDRVWNLKVSSLWKTESSHVRVRGISVGKEERKSTDLNTQHGHGTLP